MLNYKICPKCGQNTNKYHLMMVECDECIGSNKPKDEPEKYVDHVLGIFVLNPKWVKYQEN